MITEKLQIRIVRANGTSEILTDKDCFAVNTPNGSHCVVQWLSNITFSKTDVLHIILIEEDDGYPGESGDLDDENE